MIKNDYLGSSINSSFWLKNASWMIKNHVKAFWIDLNHHCHHFLKVSRSYEQIPERCGQKWLSWIIHKFAILAQKYFLNDPKSCEGILNRFRSSLTSFPQSFKVIRADIGKIWSKGSSKIRSKLPILGPNFLPEDEELWKNGRQ